MPDDGDSPRVSESQPPDPIEALLADCLLAGQPHEAIEAACRTHPEWAADLRARFFALIRMGMAPSAPAATADPPRRVGRFRLQQRGGSGGMGVVWRALEEPLGREVALKLVRSEQLGLDSARRRFLREIEAAAALSHSGIVPILAFGEADGMPWYSMPMIAGRSLADVLAEMRAHHGQPTPAMLHAEQPSWAFACCAVAAQVARALAHAHARGVVHRDVKPSNVMLAADGRALLIDFGLAQVEGADSMTKSGVQPGSLAYMSPEQVRGEPVDARTDVWSLGVVTYELLTLRQPFAADSEAGTRSNILAAAPLPLHASGSRVSWDVATVVQKALAPERRHRYAGAAEFAADLEAVIAHRPIAARDAGPWLRLARFVRRRPTLATASVLGFLLVGVGPSLLLLQEHNARRAIEREARTSQRVVALLADLFREVEPERARGATVPARVVLDRGVRQIRTELNEEPAVKAALLEAMGTVYLNLGLVQEATALLAEMHELRAPLLAGDAALRARTCDPLARLATVRGDAAGAERLWRDVVDALAATHGPAGLPASMANLQLAYAIWRQDRLDEADALLARTLATMRVRLPADDLQLAEAVLARAIFLQERLDPLQAKPLFVEALRTLRTRLPADHPRLLAALVSAAANLDSLGEHAAAAAELRSVIDTAGRVFDANHPQLAMAREQLANVLVILGDARGARLQVDLALRAYRVIYTPPHFVLARACALDGTVAFEQGDLVAAERALTEALAMYEQLFPDGHLDRAAVLSAACRLFLALGRIDAAADAGSASLAMAEQHGQRDPGARAVAHAHLGYVQALRAEHADADRHLQTALALCVERPEANTRAFVRSYAAEVRCLQMDGKGAEQLAREALADWEHLGADSGRGWALTTLGWALELQQTRNVEGERVLREALSIRERCHGADHPYVAITLTGLAGVLARQQKYEEAEAQLRRAVAVRRRGGMPDDLNLGRPLVNLAAVLFLQGQHTPAAAALRECVALLHGRVGAGHPEAQGAVLLAIRLLGTPAAAAVREFGGSVRDLAAAVYPPGHENLDRLDQGLGH